MESPGRIRANATSCTHILNTIAKTQWVIKYVVDDKHYTCLQEPQLLGQHWEAICESSELEETRHRNQTLASEWPGPQRINPHRPTSYEEGGVDYQATTPPWRGGLANSWSCHRRTARGSLEGSTSWEAGI